MLKKIVLAFALISMIATNANAQTPDTKPKDQVEQNLDDSMAGLNKLFDMLDRLSDKCELLTIANKTGNIKRQKVLREQIIKIGGRAADAKCENFKRRF